MYSFISDSFGNGRAIEIINKPLELESRALKILKSGALNDNSTEIISKALEVVSRVLEILKSSALENNSSDRDNK